MLSGIISILILIIAGTAIYVYSQPFSRRQRKILKEPFPETWKSILQQQVKFYRELDDSKKKQFEQRILKFLGEVRITGVMTEVDDRLKLLIASSAIIPVFSFTEWDYINLNEVLIYNKEVETFQLSEADNTNTILGQVRPFQAGHILLISKQYLQKGFDVMNGKENVGFHEFSHLIDEADGEIDGIPKALMPRELILPWTHLMYKEIGRIRKGNSDINPYGLTNHAEFFAVVCEYFFENPSGFRKNHKELYEILCQVFRRE